MVGFFQNTMGWYMYKERVGLNEEHYIEEYLHTYLGTLRFISIYVYH